MNELNEYAQTAIKTARKAGKMLREGQKRPLDIEKKGKINLVTDMDRKSERIITEMIGERFPEHNIVAEEGTEVDHHSGYVWYIDPVDGTTNYAHGLPWYAVCIGLFKDGEPYCGVVYNPANDELFAGQRGVGAFLNGERLHVSDRSDISESLLVTGFPYYKMERPERVLRNFESIFMECRGIRRFGSAALDMCYVAAGKYQGYWEEGLKPWDTAAGLIVLLEAGGMITDYDGGRFSIFSDTLAASNGKIHDRMLRLLRSEV